MDNTILYLPWPPTVNSYYSSGHGKVKYVSAKGRVFRDQVAQAINEQMPGLTYAEQLYVEIILHPPDRRTRDLDNYMKALLDALTLAGLWRDDSQIDQLSILRGEIAPREGLTRLEIAPAGPIIPLEPRFQDRAG